MITLNFLKTKFNTFKKVIQIKLRNKTKIFVIGFNKTGTTSIEAALREFDLIIANQLEGELLIDKIANKNYKPLYKYCNKAEVFQDIPFSAPNIYKILDKKYPNSKFILTVRDNEEQWYKSLTNYHAKLWGKGKIPTHEDLVTSTYIYKGFPFKLIKFIFGDITYNETHYKNLYLNHIKEVKNHFKNRPNKLLIINVGDNDSYTKMCSFINKKPIRSNFEWKNKTSSINTKLA